MELVNASVPAETWCVGTPSVPRVPLLLPNSGSVHLSLRESLPLAGTLPDRRGWLSSRPQGSACPHLPPPIISGVTGTHHHSWGDRWVFTTARDVLSPCVVPCVLMSSRRASPFYAAEFQTSETGQTSSLTACPSRDSHPSMEELETGFVLFLEE